MDQTEEREILRTLRELALQRDQLWVSLKEALTRNDTAAAEVIRKQHQSISAEMSPGFELLYREHHPKLRRIMLHIVRTPDHADDLEQDGWNKFIGALKNFDLERPAFPLLALCGRTSAIEYYRREINRQLPLSADGGPEAIDFRHTPEQAAVLSGHLGIRSEVFLGLLCFAMGRSGGPIHERLTFGFNRLLEKTPRDVVKEKSNHRLAEMTAELEREYANSSGLPEVRVRKAFESLGEDLPRLLFELDRATADRYRATGLAHLPTGQGRYGNYFLGPPEASVSQWADNVMRRLKKRARIPAGTRSQSRKGA